VIRASQVPVVNGTSVRPCGAAQRLLLLCDHPDSQVSAMQSPLPTSMGAPRPGVRLTGNAGPKMHEDLVDHRRLGDERDDPHGAMARRARQRVDLENLLLEGRPSAAGLGRRESSCGDDTGWRPSDPRRRSRLPSASPSPIPRAPSATRFKDSDPIKHPSLSLHQPCMPFSAPP